MFRKRRLDKRQLRLVKTLEFLARLLLLAIPLYIVTWLGIGMAPLQQAVAGQSAWVLQAMGFNVQRDGTYITVSGRSEMPDFLFSINEDCTGWKSMLFLFALVFAVPAVAMKKRLAGIAIGFPAIWLANIARVVGVVLVERAYGARFAMLVHDYAWQLGLVALVLGLWLAWLHWAGKTRKTLLSRLSPIFKR